MDPHRNLPRQPAMNKQSHRGGCVGVKHGSTGTRVRMRTHTMGRSRPVHTRPLSWESVMAAVTDTLRALGPRDQQAPWDGGLGVLTGHPTCHSPTPPSSHRRGKTSQVPRPEEALTTLSSGTDRLNVHSWLFTKASVKQEGHT